MPSEDFAYSLKLPYRKKCSLPECEHLSYDVSRFSIDGNTMDFCCTEHARIGKSRWEEKRKMGIRPGEPQRPTNPEENFESGNLPE